MFSRTADHIISHPQKTNLSGIDLIKFLCAIMVFIIHVAPFRKDVSAITDSINFILQECLCRFAVPFYFVCSGFFLFRKMPLYDLNADAIKSYCFKLLRFLGLWITILLPAATGPLWYLRATVVAIVLLSLCLFFRMKSVSIWLLACLLYTIGLLGDSYHGLISPLLKNSFLGTLYNTYICFFESTRNGIFMGFIFVWLGAFLSQYRINMKPATAAIGFVCSMVANLIELFILDYFRIPIEYNMFISLLPAVFFLFCLAYNIPLRNRSICKHLRNIGIWFYFLNLLIAKTISQFSGWLGQHFSTGIFNPVFIFALPAALLTAILLDWLSGKKKFQWLNWLIS